MFHTHLWSIKCPKNSWTYLTNLNVSFNYIHTTVVYTKYCKSALSVGAIMIFILFAPITGKQCYGNKTLGCYARMPHTSNIISAICAYNKSSTRICSHDTWDTYNTACFLLSCCHAWGMHVRRVYICRRTIDICRRTIDKCHMCHTHSLLIFTYMYTHVIQHSRLCVCVRPTSTTHTQCKCNNDYMRANWRPERQRCSL